MKINIQGEFTEKETFKGNVGIEEASLSDVKDFLLTVMPTIVASVYECVLEKMKEAPIENTGKVASVSLLLTETIKHTLDEMDDKLDDFIGKLGD